MDVSNTPGCNGFSTSLIELITDKKEEVLVCERERDISCEQDVVFIASIIEKTVNRIFTFFFKQFGENLQLTDSLSEREINFLKNRGIDCLGILQNLKSSIDLMNNYIRSFKEKNNTEFTIQGLINNKLNSEYDLLKFTKQLFFPVNRLSSIDDIPQSSVKFLELFREECKNISYPKIRDLYNNLYLSVKSNVIKEEEFYKLIDQFVSEFLEKTFENLSSGEELSIATIYSNLYVALKSQGKIEAKEFCELINLFLSELFSLETIIVTHLVKEEFIKIQYLFVESIKKESEELKKQSEVSKKLLEELILQKKRIVKIEIIKSKSENIEDQLNQIEQLEEKQKNITIKSSQNVQLLLICSFVGMMAYLMSLVLKLQQSSK